MENQINKIQSVIENCDVRTAFSKVVKFFDPNKNRNLKTNILDFSNLFIWNDTDIKIYNVTKTKNFKDIISKKTFDIILYEPPYNKNYVNNATEASKVFYNCLSNKGFVIIKTKDFKENGSPGLIGGYDLKLVFEINNFYLSDQLIYKYNSKNIGNVKEEKGKNDLIDNIHFYFMVFKKNEKSS